VPFIDRLTDLLSRLASYPWWEVVIEIAVIWLVVWIIARFLRGTRAVGALKGLLIILLVATIITRVLGSWGDAFERLTFLYDRAIALVAIALIVIFQPELRRGLIRLGETPLFRSGKTQQTHVIEAIVASAQYLAKARFGAIIVLERSVGLRAMTEGGAILDAEVSDRLLRSIFFPGSALHDLAVVIRNNRVHAAGVQLPLAEPSEMPNPDLGSRHRAAVGVTRDSDAIVIVVSEETASIRIAERGRLSKPLTADQLREELDHRLGRIPDAEEEAEVVAEAMREGTEPEQSETRTSA
jgi:diadenylate cyclase